jgi:hypothetical protein
VILSALGEKERALPAIDRFLTPSSSPGKQMSFIIIGFTAWSSVREPSQVFSLLETLYHAFDEIAKRRRVFKG